MAPQLSKPSRSALKKLGRVMEEEYNQILVEAEEAK